MTVGKYQLVWWGWRNWAMVKDGPYPDAPDERWHACVYKWRLRVGPFEVRRWS